MRARNLKPGFFTNDELAEIEPLGRILFQGLWCVADRAGRLEDRPRKIKAEVLPYDDCDVDQLLNDLSEHGFITRYESDGSRYIQVTNFNKHQNPHIKEAPSTIPAPYGHSASTMQASEENETSPADSGFLNPDTGLLTPDAGEHAREPRAPAPPSKRPSPIALDIAETLVQAPWIGDDLEVVACKVDESAAKCSGFDLARDGPFLALQFANWKGYAKKPPTNWYSAWLNWLKKERTQTHEQQTAGASVKPATDPASQRSGDPGALARSWHRPGVTLYDPNRQRNELAGATRESPADHRDAAG